MKRLVIVGATGMVGGGALRYALEQPEVEHVTSVGRRKLGISHFKLTEVLHPDFTDCSALEGTLTCQDGVVFCLGTYTGAVADAQLRKITVDYTVEFARVLQTRQPRCRVLILKREWRGPDGAESDGLRSLQRRGRKGGPRGRVSRVYIFRPAYIYPVEPRTEPNLSYRLLRWVYPAFRVAFPALVVRSDDLSRAMVDVLVHRTGERQSVVFENRDIQALVHASGFA